MSLSRVGESPRVQSSASGGSGGWTRADEACSPRRGFVSTGLGLGTGVGPRQGSDAASIIHHLEGRRILTCSPDPEPSLDPPISALSLLRPPPGPGLCHDVVVYRALFSESRLETREVKQKWVARSRIPSVEDARKRPRAHLDVLLARRLLRAPTRVTCARLWHEVCWGLRPLGLCSKRPPTGARQITALREGFVCFPNCEASTRRL